jgi:hypothetical protein
MQGQPHKERHSSDAEERDQTPVPEGRPEQPYQRYLGEHEEWRIIGDNVGRDGEVGPVDVLELREPYGLVEQRPLTVVERVGESERVPSVPQKEQRGKTLGKEQQRDCGK